MVITHGFDANCLGICRLYRCNSLISSSIPCNATSDKSNDRRDSFFGFGNALPRIRLKKKEIQFDNQKIGMQLIWKRFPVSK